MALDLTCLPTRQAKRSAVSSSAVGARLVTVLSAATSRSARSVDCASRPPSTLRYSAQPRGQRRRVRRAPRRRGTSSSCAAAPPARRGRTTGAKRISTKMPAERLHHRHVEGAVDADDAAVDRHRVRGLGARHRLAHGAPERGAARVGVLDHHCRRLLELEQQAQRRREVEQVVVAELGAVQLLHAGQPHRRRADDPVERRRLVRVLAVAQASARARPPAAADAGNSSGWRSGADGAAAGDRDTRRWPRRTAAVRRNASWARRTRVASPSSPPLPRSSVEHRAILAGIGHHGDRAVVLGGGADHGGPAHVDLLDRLRQAHAGPSHRRLERIEARRPRGRWAGSRAARAPPGARGRRVAPGFRRGSWDAASSPGHRASPGNPVTSETSRTGTAESRSSLAVPPVDRISTPSAASSRAKSTTPGLVVHADTSARRTFIVRPPASR